MGRKNEQSDPAARDGIIPLQQTMNPYRTITAPSLIIGFSPGAPRTVRSMNNPDPLKGKGFAE
jgi:hypothetical protein